MFKSYIQISVLSVLFSSLFSQVSTTGLPKSIQIGISASIPSTILPSVDRDLLLAEDEVEMSKDIPYRFGTPIEVNYNLQNSGEWEELSDGRIWRLSIRSANAYSINLMYDRFKLPEGSELYVYDKDMNTVLGAFTHKNNKIHETFSTSPTKGDITVVEYFEPTDVAFKGEIQINSVVHAYRDIFFNEARGYGSSGSCNNNVNCSEFVDWESEVRSVAMILTSGGSRICTGALVNNVRQDLTPYFLTANHCLGGESNWIFMFEYESSGCSNSDGPTYKTVQGSTLLANSSSSDFALLRLDETPPESYNIHYSGWDASGSTPSTPVCIHHPSGDIKKITFDYDNASNSGSYWDINSWNDGTTEPGSSGSPLFDGNSHRIVGQLYGGTASCSSLTYDTYGKVSSSWGNGMGNYLDPDNTGTVSIDGMDAIEIPEAELSSNASDISFEVEIDDNASSSFTISNTGELDSELSYAINSSPFQNVVGGPDGGGYFWSDSNVDADIDYSWIDISENNVLVNFSDNDASVGPYEIGFEFPFYGNLHSQFTINPNGWIGFGISGDYWDNSEIPSSSIAGPAIFGLWDDLNPQNTNCNEYCSGDVYYHSNSDRTVIWFNEVAHWWTNFENSFYDFQIVLHSNGEVDINYSSIVGTYSASVGMQGSSTVGSEVVYDSDLSENVTIALKNSPDWLSVSPQSGTLLEGESQSINVDANSTGISDGIYQAYLQIVSSGGSFSVPVTLDVQSESNTVLGDINMDNTINIQDVIILVNIVLENLEPSSDEFDAGDINSDLEINIQDVIILINIIIGN